MWKETDETNFNNMAYLTQYLKNIITQTYNQYKIINETLTCFVQLNLQDLVRVFHVRTQGRAMFQVLRSHMWLEAAASDSTALQGLDPITSRT